jgi:hypothetical protein
MKVSSPPFAVVRNGVQASAWVAGNPLDPGEPLGELITDWDSSIALSLHSQLSLEPDLLGTETGLAPGSLLRLVVGWFCESTRTRERGSEYTFELPAPGTTDRIPVTMMLEVSGSSIARALLLEGRLLLVAAAPMSAPTAASEPGSVLWYHAQRCELEDSRSRFPMEWADFRTSIHPEDAAWALDWDPHDLDASTLGAVRLLLNQRHPRTASLLREDPPSEASQLLRETIRFDVARQLVEGALGNVEFVRDPDRYEHGTIGATLRRMMAVSFPHHDVRTLAALASRSRMQFESLLQANLRLYGSIG